MFAHCHQMRTGISNIYQVWLILDFLDKFFRISQQEVHAQQAEVMTTMHTLLEASF